jgi:tetratricopeptide (TPR) repeat protein
VLLLAATAVQAQATAPAAGDPGGVARVERLRCHERVESDGTHAITLDLAVFLPTPAALASFGQIAWPYLVGLSEVAFEDVRIEKPDGRRTDVTNGLLEDVNPFGVTDTAKFADLHFKKMTVAGLEPGDRLSYRIVSNQKPLTPGTIFGGFTFFNWPGTPVQTYELDLPKASSIRTRIRERLKGTWEDVPSAPDRFVRKLTFRPERDGADASGAVQAGPGDLDVVFTGFSSWGDVARWWWDFSRERLVPDEAVKAEAIRIVGSRSTPREKIEALHAFVASRIRYLNVSFGLGRMQPRTASSVLANKYGDCKDKHALLAALATSVGLDVRPVLIASTTRDLRDDVPAPHQFDHMIGVVRLGADPKDWLWLDTTNRYGLPGYLLPPLRDKRALLVEATGEGTIVRTPADPPFVPKTEIAVTGTIDLDGALHVHEARRVRADAEVFLRATLALADRDRRQAIVRYGLASEWPAAQVKAVSVSDPEETNEPLRIEFDAERPAPAPGADGERTLWIPLPKFDLPDPPDGPASSGGDKSDDGLVEFSTLQFDFHAELDVPAGLTLRAPLSLKVERPFGTFEASYSIEGTKARLSRTLKLTRSRLSRAELASYEAFLKAIDADRDQSFAASGGAPAPAPAVTAASLHKDGVAALDKNDYAKAVELLQKAVDADAKVESGLFDLGRALSQSGKHEEAIKAFSREIEKNPFSDSAYEWRGFSHAELGRTEEAEKDYLKQIEVAPFRAWSYAEMGKLRSGQSRFKDAADFYSRATALEPKVTDRWIDLGRACWRDGRKDEAKAALDRARGLETTTAQKTALASLYEEMGELGPAGDLAAATAADWAKRLAALTPEKFGVKDVETVEHLAEAWRLIGSAAARAGDDAKAERYLEAAWKLAYPPEAGLALGNLRERQNRLPDAVELWSMAAAIEDWKAPADLQGRIEAACRKLPEAQSETWVSAGIDDPYLPKGASGPPQQHAAIQKLMLAGATRLQGDTLGDLMESVVVLVGTDGRVERIQRMTGKSEALERQLASLRPIQLSLPRPDETTYKRVARGFLSCRRGLSCSLILSSPVNGPIGSPKGKQPATGTVEVVHADPPVGTVLHKGQHIALTVTIRYTLEAADHGRINLMPPSQGEVSVSSPEASMAKIDRGTGEVTLRETFDVASDATEVQVLIPLWGDGIRSTSSVGTLRYRVE